ncbi:MAG TPA: tetratricopeptide repeat protein, partial [Planctomycetota bacterium]|nr:tetratricopeptide repeat protein [Planctomycetota bacterium]
MNVRLSAAIFGSLLLAAPSPVVAQASAPASRPQDLDPAQQRALGAELLRHGRKEEAIAAYRGAWSADHSLDSALGLSKACIADERYNDSLRVLEEAAQTHSKDVRLHRGFAEAFAARAAARAAEGADRMTVLAEYEAAARAIEDGLDLTPNDPALHVERTRYLVYACKSEEAHEAALAARKSAPTSWEAALLLGDSIVLQLQDLGLLAANGDAASDEEARKERTAKLAEAKAAYEESEKLGPDRAEPPARLASLLLQTGGPRGQVMTYLERALARDPSKVDASPVERELSPKDALAFFEKALAKRKEARGDAAAESPECAPLWWWIGRMRYMAEDHPGAEKAFSTAARLNPADDSARYYLAKIAYLEKRFGDAASEFDSVARRSPKALADLGRTDPHFAAMIRGVVGRLVTGDGAASASVTRVGGGGIGTAIHLTRALVELDPRDVGEWNNLGLFYRDTNQPQEAIAAYRAAIDLTPRDPRLLNDAAVVYHYYLRANDEEAKALYKRAIDAAKEILADRTAGTTRKEDAKGALDDAENNLE